MVQATALYLDALQQLQAASQRQCYRSWMKGEDSIVPAFDMVQRLFDEVIDSRKDAQAALHWNGFYYVRFQQQLHRLPKRIICQLIPVQYDCVVTCVCKSVLLS